MAFKLIEEKIKAGLLDILKEYIVEIILYGSVARDEATEESDIDIALIINKDIDSETKERLMEWCAKADLEFDCVLSVIDIEQSKYEAWKNVLPFYKKVNEEGIVLWKVV